MLDNKKLKNPSTILDLLKIRENNVEIIFESHLLISITNFFSNEKYVIINGALKLMLMRNQRSWLP